MDIFDVINKRRILKRKLRRVNVNRRGELLIVTKDGNRLGKRKNKLVLDMCFEFINLKCDADAPYDPDALSKVINSSDILKPD